MTSNVESTDGVITFTGKTLTLGAISRVTWMFRAPSLPDSWSVRQSEALALGGQEVRFTKRSKRDVLTVSRHTLTLLWKEHGETNIPVGFKCGRTETASLQK